jgi:DinB superfamily
MLTGVPDRTEATDYYYGYIEKVAGADICSILQTQQDETLDFLSGIPDSASLHRYAPDKWSIREVAGHVNDAERLFVSRAFWFARGFDTPLPSFDQHVAVAAAGADARPWHSHVEEFRAVRAATLTFFRGLPPEAWSRRGIASGHPFTVRALAFIAAGHVIHHIQILRERYGIE